MAAYVRLTSRSQAKFQNNEIESHSILRTQPHLRRVPPVVHFLTFTVPVAFPRHFKAWKEVSLWLLHRSLVAPRCGRFQRRFWPEIDFIPSLWAAVLCWQDGRVTWQVLFPWNRNWSFPGARTTEDGAIHTTVAISMRDWRFAHRILLVMCARTGCLRRGKR